MITLPARIERKLLSESPYPVLHGAVVQGLAGVQTWFDDNGPRMVFFPDYTDHGPKHLRAILDLADFLIADGSAGRPDSWRELTPQDAAVLVWAILVHDLGMHLNETALLALLHDSPIRFPSLDQHTWLELWTSFLGEARRWDGRTRINVTGSIQPDSVLFSTKTITCEPQTWTPADFRIVGEFIRRNHPRLAHEIAVFGWPTIAGAPIPTGSAVFAQNPELADLAGLVARSHGHNLRDLLPYLKSHHFNTLESRGVHPVFLMGVLRIADFLHLHAERAPQTARGLRRLASPVSTREWDAHAAIYDVRLDTESDPEAIAVDVSARSVIGISAYLRIREWLGALQSEIDQTWAVMGEVYGRHERLRKLWLTVRRITSNLHGSDFERELKFIPVEARFATAGADLLKLLIFPLYGDEPGLGIRELVQNGVDAVRERALLEGGTCDESPDTWPPLDDRWVYADLVVRLGSQNELHVPMHRGGPPQHWERWIEVSDRGTGMSLDIIKNYFLKAGASFRFSDAWKQSFEHEDEVAPNQPRSKILRSGRFGIGALAAFLLGDQIHVSTRHFTDDEGYTFSAELETEEIQISRVSREIGTAIYVRITGESAARAYYSGAKLYRLEWPAVVAGDAEDDESFTLLPAAGAELPASWHRINPPHYQEVQWTYTSAPDLTCNGIVISEHNARLSWPERPTSSDWNVRQARENLDVPNLSVFDPDGRLPLNLARTNTRARALPFFENLLDDVARDFLAFALLFAPTAPLRGRNFPAYLRLRYPGFNPDYSVRYWRPTAASSVTFVPWMALGSGVCIPDPHLLTWAGVDTLIGLVRRRGARWVPAFQIPPAHAVIGFDTDGDDSVTERIWPLAEPNFFPETDNPLNVLRITGGRALLDEEVATAVEGTRWIANSSTYVQITEAVNNLALLESDRLDVKPSLLNDLLEYAPLQRNSSQACFILEWRISPDRDIRPSRVSELWKQIIRRPVIPYDTASRRALIEEARPELGSYLDKWAKQSFTDVDTWEWEERYGRAGTGQVPVEDSRG